MSSEDSDEDVSLPDFSDGRDLQLPQASAGEVDSSDDLLDLPELANATKDWILRNEWATPEQIASIYDGTLLGSVLEQLRGSGLFDKEQLQELEEVERLADTLPQFILDKRLGAGAVGAVYRATHRETGIRVALKFLHQHIDGMEEHRERFEREAATLAQLDHPVIPRLIDHSRAQEAGDFWITGHIYEQPPYLAMEYVEGMTLRELIQQAGAVPEPFALWAMAQVAKALQHAHDRAGIIHRDIKPDNIIVEKPREAPVSSLYREKYPLRIIDFGLAKIGVEHENRHIGTDAYRTQSAESSGPQPSAAATEMAEDLGEDGLTLVGTVLGTPRYMAPEQIMGEELDWRADLYALGATLYHLLTGEPPYDGNSPADVMMRHVKDPIPNPKDLVPSVSTRASHITMRTLEKKKEKRFPGYLDFAEACERAIAALDNKTGPNLLSRPYRKGGTERHTRTHTRGPGTGAVTRSQPATSNIRPGPASAPASTGTDGALEPKTGYVHRIEPKDQKDASGSTTIVTQRLTKTIQSKVRGEVDPFDVPSLEEKRDEQEKSTTYLLRYQPEKEEATDPKPWIVLALCALVFIGALIFRFVI